MVYLAEAITVELVVPVKGAKMIQLRHLHNTHKGEVSSISSESLC